VGCNAENCPEDLELASGDDTPNATIHTRHLANRTRNVSKIPGKKDIGLTWENGNLKLKKDIDISEIGNEVSEVGRSDASPTSKTTTTTFWFERLAEGLDLNKGNVSLNRSSSASNATSNVSSSGVANQSGHRNLYHTSRRQRSNYEGGKWDSGQEERQVMVHGTGNESLPSKNSGARRQGYLTLMLTAPLLRLILMLLSSVCY